MICSLCDVFQCVDLKTLLGHINISHSKCPNFEIRCDIINSNCGLIFTKYNSFYKHIIRHHSDVYKKQGEKNLEIEQVANNTVTSNENTASHDEEMDIAEDELHFESAGSVDTEDESVNSDNNNYDVNEELHIEDLKKAAATYLLQVREHNKISQRSLDSIIELTGNLFERHLNVIKSEILSTINFNRDENRAVEEIFAKNTNIFCGLETEALQNSFIKETFEYVDFTAIPLGNKLVKKKAGDGTSEIVSKEESFIYVPIIESLKQLLSNKKTEKILLTTPQQQKENIYYDICDGNLYKNDDYFKQYPNALILILYHDELEVCNPLGSRAGTHKVDMYYYTIGNLSPRFRSKHSAVRLLAIANANLVKKYGIEKVLQPIIKDLKSLHNGVRVFSRDNEMIDIRGKVLLCAGDTLAQNYWGGFKEGVGFSYQKCRVCYCTAHQMQAEFVSDKFLHRSHERYLHECSLMDGAPSKSVKADLSTTFGINKKSCLVDLPDFDITKQLPQDIMHVLLEGVVQYELRLILLNFIETKEISLAALNSAILHHNYGYSEISDKPEPLRETVFFGDEQYKLKYNASQSRLFLRIVPYILETLIDIKNNKYFWFATELLQIVNIVFSPVISLDTIQVLKQAIAEHLENFVELFPQRNIIPKQHFMIHFPDLIKDVGPLVRSSCFSFEAAHKYFKEIARKQNFKNLNFSLAKRCQLLECINFERSDAQNQNHPIFASDKKYGVLKLLKKDEISVLRRSMDKLCLLPGIEIERAYKVSWILLFGIKYSRNGVIITSACSERFLPIFGTISEIILIGNYVYFNVKLFSTYFFDEAFQAYNLQESSELLLVPYEGLVDYNVYHVKKNSNGKLYVSPKYDLNDIIEEYLHGDNILLK